MILQVTKHIGRNNYTMNFSGEDLHEALMEAQQVSFNGVKVCGLCQKDNLVLKAFDQQFKYIKVQCLDCGATLTLGKQKETGAYFLRRKEDKTLDWQPKFVAEEKQVSKPKSVSTKWEEEE